MTRPSHTLAALLALAAGPLLAGETPADFAARLPIQVPAGAALVRITLPESAYAALAGPDLSDLRIFNAAGEALPTARLPAPRETAVEKGRAPLLPLPETTPQGGDSSLRISRAPDGTLLRVDIAQPAAKGATPAHPSRYLADLKPFGQPITALVLEPADATPFEGSLRLETSDDLATWQLLRDGERVLALRQGDQRVERLRLALPALRARYLRLTWSSGPAPVTLAALGLEHASETPPTRQWLKLPGQPGDAPGVWRYATPGLFPVDRLEVVAAEPNSVAQVVVDSRAASRDPWQYRANFTAYRLNTGEGEITSPPAPLPSRRDPLWQIKLQPAMAHAPTLAIGWLPETLVFAARGTPPFTLAVGQARLPAAYLPIETLVPAYGTDRAPALAEGHVLPPSPGSIPPKPRDTPAWQDGRSLGLWAALVLGVAVLGWMAVGLLRERRGEAEKA